jgi:hypothetical protein
MKVVLANMFKEASDNNPASIIRLSLTVGCALS